ncbi:hypothetical protein [Gracilibacillus thailandensis]|nr:hypothetical protein [Gracilibacillus thailandensis]
MPRKVALLIDHTYGGDKGITVTKELVMTYRTKLQEGHLFLGAWS